MAASEKSSDLDEFRLRRLGVPIGLVKELDLLVRQLTICFIHTLFENISTIVKFFFIIVGQHAPEFFFRHFLVVEIVYFFVYFHDFILDDGFLFDLMFFKFKQLSLIGDQFLFIGLDFGRAVSFLLTLVVFGHVNIIFFLVANYDTA